MESQLPVYYTDTETRKSYDKVGRIYQAIEKQWRSRCIEYILQTEGDINYRISASVPDLLHEAWHDCDPFHLLIKSGVNFTRKNGEGRTALLKRIHEKAADDLLRERKLNDGHVDAILDAHVKFGNSTNPYDETGMSHFHAACIANNASAVEFFLKNGADVNGAVSANSQYFPLDVPLHFAVNYASLEVIEILLNYGANTLLKNANGWSPFHLFIEAGIKTSQLEDSSQSRGKCDTFLKCAIRDLSTVGEFDFNKLHMACLLRDQSLVQSVLDEGANINEAVNLNSVICPGFTALHFAIFDDVQMFKFLLKNGADIKAKNAKGETPFDLSLQRYKVADILAILSTKNEWRNIILSDKETKLIDVVSAMDNFDEFISFLDRTKSPLTMNIPFGSPLWPGYTLLHLAVIFAKNFSVLEFSRAEQKVDTKIVAECLKRGADMTVTDAKGSSALHVAFYMGKRDVVEYLLDHHDAVVNPVDKDNLSHFHIACAAGRIKIIEHFLSNCVNVNLPVLSTYHMWHFYICPGSTALHISIGSGAKGKETMIQSLLDHGADVNAQDANGFTPVHRLLVCRTYDYDKKICDLLLSVGNLKNVTTNCGLNHLHVACYFHNSKAIEKLLSLGTDINVAWTDKRDVNYRKDCHNLYFLPHEYSHKLSTFSAHCAGSTPLHFSLCRKENCEVTSKLIERGADLLAKNAKGTSPLDVLLNKINSRDSHFRFSMLNESVAATTLLEEKFGITKLCLACSLDVPDVDLLLNLIDGGANVNAKVHSDAPIWQGRTSLHFAVKKVVGCYRDATFIDAYVQIVRLLIEKGADPLIMDDNNETPFHLFTFYDVASHFVLSVLFKGITNFNVNPTDNKGCSLFHIACISGNAVAIKKYLEHGVDVNQSISHFCYYCYHPGATPLHLLAAYHPLVTASSSWCESSEETLLQIIDTLLEMGADVSAIDAVGNTPLAKVIAFREEELSGLDIRVTGLRRVLIQKLISNRANLHATHLLGCTAFESLLVQGDACWEEIELFLNGGCHFNVYNPVTQVGYMANFFVFRRKKEFESNKITDNPMFLKVIQDTKIAELDNVRRTAIHNVVSIHNYDDERDGRARYSNHPTDYYNEFYADLIEQLSIQGCDIDHENSEGKTALHSAVFFKNHQGIIGLLKNGADINITDKNDKTAFAYCEKPMRSEPLTPDVGWLEIDEDLNDANLVLAMHAYKLEFCGLTVSDQNKQMQAQTWQILGPFDKEVDCFRAEIENAKGVKMGTTSLSLYEFLISTDTDVTYIQMTSEERQEVDRFVVNVGNHNFPEIVGLLRLKYRQIIVRIKMIQPALESLNVLTKYQLPDLCCRMILKFLANNDLKCLIAAVA